MPFERAIKEFRFAFGPAARVAQMERPPHMIDLDVLSPELRRLFVQAFTDGSEAPNSRPSAKEWLYNLDAFRVQLRTCRADPGHNFGSHLSVCPWCAVVSGGGYNYFLGNPSAETIFVVDLPAFTRLWDRVERIRPTAFPVACPVRANSEMARFDLMLPAPFIFTYKRPEHLSRSIPPPPPLSEFQENKRFTIRIIVLVAISAGMIGLLAVLFDPWLGAFGIVVAFASWILLSILSDTRLSAIAIERSRRQQAAQVALDNLCDAERDWRSEVENHNRASSEYLARTRQHIRALEEPFRISDAEWQQTVNGYQTRFHTLTRELEELRGQCVSLQTRYLGEKQRLERNAESLCRDQFLRTRLLSDYDNIPLIGPTRRQTLSFFGIETAFDVETIGATAIKGFGPTLIQNLLEWKQCMLAEFLFDPKAGIPEQEFRQLAMRFQQEQTALRQRLERGLAELEGLASQTEQHLGMLRSRMDQLRKDGDGELERAEAALKNLGQQTQQRLTPIYDRINMLIGEMAQAKTNRRFFSWLG